VIEELVPATVTVATRAGLGIALFAEVVAR
jgi:hypothetical protein